MRITQLNLNPLKKIRNFITLVFFILNLFIVSAGVEIFCQTRYLYQVYHPPVEPQYWEGSVLGRVPIAGTGRDGYYEDVWSSLYSINVNFFSGFEVNEYYNSIQYDNNAIIAVVKWQNGGRSVVEIENWYTNQKYLTEDEIKYSSNGQRIYEMNGFDKEGRYWEFYF